jgi:hypothetical protein
MTCSVVMCNSSAAAHSARAEPLACTAIGAAAASGAARLFYDSAY